MRGETSERTLQTARASRIACGARISCQYQHPQHHRQSVLSHATTHTQLAGTLSHVEVLERGSVFPRQVLVMFARGAGVVLVTRGLTLNILSRPQGHTKTLHCVRCATRTGGLARVTATTNTATKHLDRVAGLAGPPGQPAGPRPSLFQLRRPNSL